MGGIDGTRKSFGDGWFDGKLELKTFESTESVFGKRETSETQKQTNKVNVIKLAASSKAFYQRPTLRTKT
jgi:hypothetical protein